jgi:spermidine synthase
VVGLGVGAIAAYPRSNDYIRFYEINPAVVDLSYSGPNKKFSFTSACLGKVDVVLGDARVSMARELARNEPGRFDILAIDAFSGDTIPVHLLTQEAFEVYQREINPATGIIAFHISNRSLDLRPVLASLAHQFRKKAWLVDYTDPESGGRSVWVLIGEIDSPFSTAMSPLHADHALRVWTDNYSSLFSVLR